MISYGDRPCAGLWFVVGLVVGAVIGALLYRAVFNPLEPPARTERVIPGFIRAATAERQPRPRSSPWALSAQMPSSSAGRVSVISAPRLHPYRIPRHDDEVGHPAAALGAAELQILDRHIAAAGIDDGLQISGCLMVAGLAPHEYAQPTIVRQHATRGR
jgi:hypothetical protein